MRVPLDWLSDYCDPGLPTEQLAERLALTGTEVDRVLHHGVSALEHFVVGRVLSAEQHPDADRLRVCSVDIGTATPSGIVCGAPNVAAGQLVGVARPGAVMPDGTKLKKAKLRGVASEGMILSEREVEVGVGHDGIMVLDADAAPGTPLLDVLPISTDVLELEITPNRPDCLAIYGVAREVHAATGAELGPPPWASDPGSAGPVAGVEVAVEVPDLCPRFTARAFDDVTIAESPPWLKARLMAAGQRPINNVVDITNYVMLLTGQPLHAFDLDRVAGGRLVVRAAREGEQIETLDEQVRTLHADEILIDDADGPTSLAGVMGGSRSEVADDTTTRAARGRRVARADDPEDLVAPGAAQRGVQPLREGPVGRDDHGGPGRRDPAPDRAVRRDRAAGDDRRRRCAWGRAGPAASRAARHRAARRAEVPRARQSEILTALGFGVRDAEDGLDVEVPHYRRMDVTREADLIEEVARIDGVDRLPATLPSRRGASGRLTRVQRARRRAEDVLVGRGLHEIVGWSFTEPGVADRLRLSEDDPRRAFVPLAQPDERGPERPAHDAARLAARRRAPQHRARQRRAAAVRGGRDLPGPGRARCRSSATRWARCSRAGHAADVARRRRRRRGTFSPPRRLVGALLDTLRTPWDVRPGTHPFLHPGRSGRIFSGETELGWVGEVHPLVAREWELDATVAAFELDLDLAIDAAPEVDAYADVTSFPALHQDLALVVGEDVAAADVLATVRRAAGKLLESVDVFDVYRGAQVGEGKLSLAVHLSFRAPDRTLTDDDVRVACEKALEARWPTSTGRRSVAENPTVLVAGASGYAGALAAALLDRHPHFDLVAATSRSDAGVRLDELYPYHRVPLVMDAFDVDTHGDVDAAIVAYPHGAAAPTVAELHERGVKVVDLSADFRLRDPGTYAEWYGEHGAPALFGHGVYGLPELYRDEIRESHLVANPGCYPTATLLGLAPLARAGQIKDVVIDAKSGVSGAGRSPTAATHFVTADENVTPYKVGAHRHAPEIEQELAVLGSSLPVSFTPHLMPLDQGELVSCYVTPERPMSQAEVDDLFVEAYAGERVRRARVEAARACATCATRTSAASTRSPTSGSARCSSSARSTTCGRAPRRRRCRT